MPRMILNPARMLFLAICLMATAAILPAAGVDGTWNLVFITEVGDRPFAITLKSDGESVVGPFMDQEMKGTYREGKLELKLDEFYSPDAGFKAPLSLQATVADGKLEGTWKFAEYSGPIKGALDGAGNTQVTVNGLWKFILITEIGDKPAEVRVSADGETVTGTAGEQAVTGSFKDGVLSLNIADFYAPEAGFKADLKLQGKVNGSALDGTWNFGEHTGPLKGNRGE